MATAAGLSPNGNDDPFISSNPHGHPSPHRYASYDHQVFSLYNSGSPAQAKRALEAHLKDTDRRIQDASKLGTTLVQQRKDLAARLKEVEEASSEEISPELKQKLEQLEKDYTEIGKESARAFLPKSRIVSTDFSDIAKQSPAVFATEARPSPAKPANSSRRQRNQPSNRVHDIEFATEISTSLLAQLRQLQAVLAEKENALKHATAHKEQLEMDMEALGHRLRTLDESEQKCKDENWNLETQMQELTAQLKKATDKEQRLTQQLRIAQAEKEGAERELEELKAAHGKLSDDHESVKKHHEAELFGLRRDVTNHQSARDALLKKVEELTAQNTQLAKAVAARWHDNQLPQDRDRSRGRDNGGADVETPEVSPQNSPIKPTPRHGMLETETLKSSLTHAHRMIQNLKNTVHREKTEKFELKRMLQDARDELETKREGGVGPALSKKRRAEDSGVKFKKPQKLGATRPTQREIIIDDDEWEDQSVESPSRTTPRAFAFGNGTVPFDHAAFAGADSTDAFETANERDTTDAFETANESDDNTTTETEGAFQTGAETFDEDSSADLTETESSVQREQLPSSRPASRPGPFPTGKAGDRSSFMSTASTSADEYEDVKTPVQAQQPKYKLRLSRGRRSTGSGSARNSAVFASDSADSPVSQTSQTQFGQSLSAELDGLSDESESGEETPAEEVMDFTPSSPQPVSQSTASDAAEETIIELPRKFDMVDSGMMTEPWEPESRSVVDAAAGAVGTAIAGVAGFALGHASGEEKEEMKDAAKAGAPADGETATAAIPALPGQFVESEPSSETASPKHIAPEAEQAEPKVLATPEIKKEFANIVSQNLAPVQPAVKEPERLAISTLSTAYTEPLAPVEAVKEPETLAMSTFSTSHTEPVMAAPSVKQPENFAMSTFSTSHTEPIAVSREVEEPEKLSISHYSAAHTEPVAPSAEVKAPETFSMSTGPAAYTEPLAPVQQVKQPEPFAMSSFKTAHTEPVSTPAPEPVQVPSFSVSSFASTNTEPVMPVEKVEKKEEVDPRKDTLTFSTVRSQDWEPIADEDHPYPTRGSSKRPALFFMQDERELPEDAGNAIPGTDSARPGSAFLATSETQFPPRTSSRDGSRPKSPGEPRLFGGAKGATLEEPTLVFADENVPTPLLELDSQFRQPFAEVSNNIGTSARSMSSDGSRPALIRSTTSEMGTQTMVSAEEIDKMMRRKTPMQIPAVNIEESSPFKPESPRRASETPAAAEADNIKAPRRPASAGSMRRNGAVSPPPLPTDHSQRIAAASQKSLSPQSGQPIAPTATLGKPPPSLRSRTPSIQSGRGTVNRPLAIIPSGRQEPMSPTTRASSISSFASEVDERLQTRHGVLYPEDVMPATDPRMIQAITQTMIGEYLWKYTRKAGRSEISATRHRRFFWVHPYTRTLYWSEHDPSTLGKQQMKAKSVAVEAVRIMSDDNAYPPGLHRKSLVVITPGREIVFTAPTAQRHETWFNSLSYLLLRTGPERENEMTQDDVDEFNPQMRSTSRNTVRTRMSLSSYNSRTTRGSSPQRPHASEVPSLAQRQSAAASQRRGAQTPGSDGSGRMGIMGGLFKSPGSMRGSFSSRRSKSAMSTRRPLEPTIYDASIVEDSTDDLRAVIEGQEQNLDRLENVRACCDGKHDVGSLSRSAGQKVVGSLRHTHSHPTPGHGHAHHSISDTLSVSQKPRRGE